jgi:uncharacterized membrane protein YphA (DoxX/SURF4 family)
MKYFIWFLRIVVGVLFIFSGLVKANDPLGLTYKMDEIFDIWHMSFMAPYTLYFSIAMIAFEIIAGVALLIGYAFRLLSFLLLLLNLFYTFLTAYALFSGNIKECGCFGDCFKISNEATFGKDVVLLIMSVILFAYRSRVVPLFSKYVTTALMILTVFFSFFIQWYMLEHLPFYDCLAYKPGNNLFEKMQPAPDATPDVYETTFIYEKDGVKKEFNSTNYPWQDSTWKFVDKKDKLIKAGTGQPAIPHDFAILDSDQKDHTEEILKTKGYQCFFFLRRTEDARTDNMETLRGLIAQAKQAHIPFYFLCSTDYESGKVFASKWGLDIPPYIMDVTISKTVMRSNPGLMLLKDGTVVHKWSYRDYPKTLPVTQ